MAGTAVGAVKVTAGGVVLSVLGFLSANFNLAPKTAVGTAIIAFLSYVIGALVHKAPAVEK
jgi:hypothetical protein